MTDPVQTIAADIAAIRRDLQGAAEGSARDVAVLATGAARVDAEALFIRRTIAQRYATARILNRLDRIEAELDALRKQH